MLEFSRLRAAADGWRGSFEALIRQLGRVAPPANAREFRHIHGAGGDGGIEAYWVLQNGDEIGYQAKFHTHVRDIDWSAIDASVFTAMKTHPHLILINVAVACDLTDRVSGRKGRTGWEAWENHRTRWAAAAKTEGRDIEFELWGASEIEQRLATPDAIGLRDYWFDETVLSPEWFEAQFERTVAMLDERFHPEDHVELEATKIFEGLRRTKSWCDKLVSAVKLLREDSGIVRSTSTDTIRDAFSKVEVAVRAALSREGAFQLAHDQPIPVAEWRSDLAQLSHALRSAMGDLDRDQRSRASGNAGNDRFGYDRDRLQQLWQRVDDLDIALKAEAQRADSQRCAVIFGRAGSGKSHFLASETAAALAAGEPAIMLLGTDFTGTEEPGAQIVGRLGLQTSFTTFLGMMNAVAEARGSRALLVLDALNEGAGSAVWKDRLKGFITTVLKHNRLALCLSCRTEFIDFVVSPKARTTAVEIVLHGFVTIEEQERAAEVYLDRRGILRPSTPWPSPEFSNPLFLRTACVALQADGRRTFPPGLHGTRKLISFYLDTAARHLGTGYDGSDDLRAPLRKAMLDLAAVMASNRLDHVDRLNAAAIIDEAFATYECPPGLKWIDVLRRHGLVRSDPGPVNDDPLAFATDIYRFGFQRFQDHLTAQALLDGVPGPDGIFEEGGALAFLLGRYGVKRAWAGVFQALTMEFADRWKSELVDCLPGGFDIWWQDAAVEDAFIESVRWRTPGAFNARTDELLDQLQGGVEAFDLLLELSPVPDHPLNAARLHALLSSMKLAARDARWTVFINLAYVRTGQAAARLVEWCFGAGRPRATDESLRLVLLALGWCFASSDGRLRDRSTKAAVAILLDRPKLAYDFVDAFSKIDDPYVVERVVASVAGACLRDPTPGRVMMASEAIWKNIFADGPTRPHLLMRDYARVVIELANDRGVLPSGCDLVRCRPPYGSPAPRFGLTEAKVKAKAKAVGDHSIFSSCAGWGGDFGRYVIQSRLRDFTCMRLSLSRPMTYEQAFEAYFEQFVRGDEKREAWLQILGFWYEQWQDAEGDTIVELEANIAEIEDVLLSGMPREARQRYAIDVKAHLRGETGWQGVNDRNLAKLDSEQAKLWVARRALRLGWTKALFPNDSSRGDEKSRASRTERIGKKYQWIAFQELLARLSDNYWLAGEWGEATARSYDTPLDLEFTRDIDPTIPPADRLPIDKLLSVPCLEIQDIEPEKLGQWVFDESFAKERLRLGLCGDIKDEGEWLTLYRYSSAKLNYSPQSSHPSAPYRQDDFHFLQMLAVPKAKLVAFRSRAREAKVDFHDWLGHELTDGPFLYEAGVCSTWPEREWIDTNVWRKSEFNYLSFTTGYHWEWHLDGSLPEGFTLRAPNPWLIRSLGITADPNMPGHYRDNSGQLIIVSDKSTSHSYCIIRRSACLALLQTLDVEPLWVGIGERTGWPDRSENAGPRRRWNGLMWLQANGDRAEIWVDDHIPAPLRLGG